MIKIDHELYVKLVVAYGINFSYIAIIGMLSFLYEEAQSHLFAFGVMSVFGVMTMIFSTLYLISQNKKPVKLEKALIVLAIIHSISMMGFIYATLLIFGRL